MKKYLKIALLVVVASILNFSFLFIYLIKKPNIRFF